MGSGWSRWRSCVGVTLASVGLLAAAVLAGEPQQGRRRTGEVVGRAVQRIPGEQPSRLRLTPARANALADAASRGLDYVPGEVLVQFKPGMGAGSVSRALAAARVQQTEDELRWVGDFAVVEDYARPDSHALAATLRSLPDVESAEPNYLARSGPRDSAFGTALGVGSTGLTPNDPDFASMQWNFPAIDLPRAWDISPGGLPTIIIAIVDTGITTTNETLNFPLWTGSSFADVDLPFAVNTDMAESRLVKPMDFVFFDAGGPVLDMDGHGTHVGGTAAENTNNGFGLAGIAYNVQIMPVKVCLGYWEVMIGRALDGVPGFAPTNAGGCPFDAIADGVRYAVDNGARVINISLGGDGQSTVMRNALDYAVGQGAFISISNGNNFEDENTVRYPSGYAQQINGAMSVAAVGRSLTKAYYSTTGSQTEIAAPGGSSRDGAAGSGKIWQSTLRQFDVSPFRAIPRFDRYEATDFQGTSMAAPHVAGVAALLMSRGITRPSDVEAILRLTARDLGAAGRDDEFGHGLVQARAALFGLGIR